MELWGSEVGFVDRSPVSGGGIWAGSIVFWAGEGNGVFEGRQSPALVCGARSSPRELKSFVGVVGGGGQ